ncbi:MAG TPA: hypothetical protein VN688_25750 [Gemmataceae bacterium]|nr:hypothetical protein [Gemmataceae bacterium]
MLVSWPLVRRARPSRTGGAWSIALALGLGCAAGQIGVEGWRSFPPREVADRLFYLTFVAVALSILRSWRSCLGWLLGTLRAIFWLVLVWFVLPPSLRKEASGGVLASWIAGLGMAGLFFWVILGFTARRLPGTTLPLILLIVSTGTVGVLYRGHSVTLTQLAGTLAAAFLPILMRSVCWPPIIMATAPIMVLLPGLWLRSYFYDYEPPPTLSFALLAAATLMGVLGLIPGIRLLAPWQKCLLCAVAASLLAAEAVSVAYEVPSAKPEEYLQINRGIP